MMPRFADRIKIARERLTLTQEQLAEKVGISQVAINKLEKGKALHTRFLIPLAKALKVTPEWLLFGETSENLQSIDKVDIISVPLVEWEWLVKWGSDYFVNLENKENLAMVFAPAVVGEKAFAVRLENDSMVSSSYGNSFSVGEIIVISPYKSYKSGSFVIAHHRETHECIFRQYFTESGMGWLIPLNPQYGQRVNANNYEILGTCCYRMAEVE